MNPIVYTALLASALSTPGADNQASPHSRPADIGPFANTRPRRALTPPMPSISPLVARKKPRVSEWPGELFGQPFSR